MTRQSYHSAKCAPRRLRFPSRRCDAAQNFEIEDFQLLDPMHRLGRKSRPLSEQHPACHCP